MTMCNELEKALATIMAPGFGETTQPALTPPVEGDVEKAIVNLRRFEKAFESDLGYGSKLLRLIADLLTSLSAECERLTRMHADAFRIGIAHQEAAKAAERERDSAKDELEGSMEAADELTEAWKRRALTAERERDEALKKVARLKERDEELSALEAFGVDHWEAYEEALATIKEPKS